MEKKQQVLNFVKYAVYVVLPVLVLVALAGGWFYFGKPSNAKQRVLATLNLPAGRVGSYTVGVDEVMAWEELETKSQLPSEYSLQNSIRLRAVAAGKIGYDVREVEQAFVYLQQDPEFGTYIQASGAPLVKTTLATDYVVRYKLRQWYAAHPELESRYGTQVAAVQAALASGQDFAVVAAAYSADPATKYFGGDLGYVDVSAAVPEYASAVSKLTPRTVTVLHTRYGTHFVELLEKAQNGDREVVRLREIVVETSGFDAWLAGQMGTLSVRWYYGT
ncbi:MAG: peptidylprolyl isomerase [Candidatus Doudnabacteria bacterium]|nr:peptidylprolyl isomerase [Candidatus Doudnabacteria bacterium]